LRIFFFFFKATPLFFFPCSVGVRLEWGLSSRTNSPFPFPGRYFPHAHDFPFFSPIRGKKDFFLYLLAFIERSVGALVPSGTISPFGTVSAFPSFNDNSNSRPHPLRFWGWMIGDFPLPWSE